MILSMVLMVHSLEHSAPPDKPVHGNHPGNNMMSNATRGVADCITHCVICMTGPHVTAVMIRVKCKACCAAQALGLHAISWAMLVSTPLCPFPIPANRSCIFVPFTPVQSMLQVSNWTASRYAFKAGDRILLAGTFTTGISLALSRSYGNASMPITITSLNPKQRATIAPTAGSAIYLFDSSTAPAKGLGITITDLNMVGPGSGEPGCVNY